MRNLVVPLALLALNCGDPTGAVEPVALHLDTPFRDDGAVAVTVTGAGFASVSAPDGYVVLSRQETPDTLKLLVFGNLVDGPVAFLDVQHARRRPLKAFVTAVARRDNSVRENPVGYALRFSLAEGPS